MCISRAFVFRVNTHYDFALSHFALIVLCCVVQSLLPASTEKMIDVLTKKNGEGKTPLQLAIEKYYSG